VGDTNGGGAINGLPLGLVLMACGLVAGLRGRDQEFVSRVAYETPAVSPSMSAN
jgi:hypothetical protein